MKFETGRIRTDELLNRVSTERYGLSVISAAIFHSIKFPLLRIYLFTQPDRPLHFRAFIFSNNAFESPIDLLYP